MMTVKSHPVPKVGDIVVLNEYGFESIYGTNIGAKTMSLVTMKVTAVDKKSMTEPQKTFMIDVDNPELNQFMLSHWGVDIVRSAERPIGNFRNLSLGDNVDLAETFIDKEFRLSGVDTVSLSTSKAWGDEYEDCQAVNFKLDGVTFSAIEDPSDGYRSTLNVVKVIPDNSIKNTFPECRVVARDTSLDHEDRKTVSFVDIITGRTVLEIGTNYRDDYYPSFVGYFNPTAMVTNTVGASNVHDNLSLSCRNGSAVERSEGWGSF
jgi:hypothetical protein